MYLLEVKIIRMLMYLRPSQVTCQTAPAYFLQKNGAHFMLIHRSVFFTRVYAHEYVGIEILAGIFQVEMKKRA